MARFFSKNSKLFVLKIQSETIKKKKCQRGNFVVYMLVIDIGDNRSIGSEHNQMLRVSRLSFVSYDDSIKNLKTKMKGQHSFMGEFRVIRKSINRQSFFFYIITYIRLVFQLRYLINNGIVVVLTVLNGHSAILSTSQRDKNNSMPVQYIFFFNCAITYVLGTYLLLTSLT